MAAILAAILEFGYVESLKPLGNGLKIFLVPQNIYLDALFVILTCLGAKL